MAHLPPEALRSVLLDRDFSDDLALGYVLADIPFLTVGILAFCTFTLLALTGRLGIMLTTLHLSIIAAWLSATLDLSQIWQRGRLNTDLGLQLDSVQSLIVTREVGYALSNSLRLFFFWIFVTRPPKAERDTPDARAGTHSGTWNAWGFIGIILRWLTLCLIVSVFTLQVVWRLDSNSDDFPAIYSAESAIEVILSAIFTFKLLLNCFRCTVVSKWICALDYLGFIIPSLFGFGIGIANLVCLKFTESILGRFLQGISFYILVLCSLLLVFLPLREPKLRRITPIRLLSPKQPASSFNITTPNVSTPSLSVQPRSDSPMIHRSQSEEPPSTAQITGWLAIQKQGPSDSNDRGVSWVDMSVQLWDQNRAERGQSSWVETPKGSNVFKEVYGYPDSYLGTGPVRPPPIEKPKPEAPRLGMGYTRSATPPSFDLSLSSLEMVDRNPFQVDSPVFGLYGIVQSSNGKSGFRPRVSVTITDSSEGSVISDLIHKQEELDKSIAVLGLLGSPVGPPSSPLSSKRSGIRSAAQSDFSLSNFPDPPWSNHPDSDTLSEPPRSPSPTPTTRPSRLNPPSVSVDNVAFDLVPPQLQIPAPTTEYSLPVSDIADSDVVVPIRKPRSDSQGTQYDVTSFIGNLTNSPMTPPLPSSAYKKNIPMSPISMTFDGPEPIGKNVTLQQPKLGYPFLRMPIISTTAPRILPATRVMLPSNPKLDISPRRPAFPRLRQDTSADTFERSRVMPSV